MRRFTYAGPKGIIVVVWIAILGLTTINADDGAGVKIDYTLQKSGRVSAGIYDQNGRLVRTLLRGKQQEAGQHTVRWEGLNRQGEPKTPGEYTFKRLRKPPFRKKFVTRIGVNPGSKPYHRWVGNHSGASSVAVDDSGMYVACTVTEGPPVLIKQTIDGSKRLWTRTRKDVSKGRYQGGLSLAADRGRVYMLQQNGYVQVIRAENGTVSDTWDVLPEDKQRKSDGGDTLFVYNHEHRVAGIDLAVSGGTAVVSYRNRNAVRWLASDGTTKKEVPVDQPEGIAVDSENRVYVVSGQRIVRIAPDGTKTVIVRDLSNPRRITVDSSTGDLLIAEGPGDWRIKRYALSGDRKQTYGRKGGRREGRYVSRHVRGVTDLTADGNGGFLVAEPHVAPRRVAHFDADGTVRNEWYGGLPFFAWRSVDPRDPTRVWYQAGNGWAVLAEVNYETGNWSVLETHRINAKAKGLARASFGGKNSGWVVRYRDGKRYLVSESFPQVFHHHDHRLEPVVISHRSGRLGPLKEDGAVNDELLTIGRLKGKDDPEAWARKTFGDTYPKYNTYLWTDANGDREPQGHEITFHKLGNIYAGPGSGAYVDQDFTVLMTGSVDDEGDRFTPYVHELEPVMWKEAVPQYAFPEKQWGLERRVEIPTYGIGDGRIKGRSTFRDEDGDIYAFYGFGPGYAGAWPTDAYGGISRLSKWSSDGTLKWSVGREATVNNRDVTAVTPPGQLHDPAKINGLVRNTIVVTDRVVHPGMAWTTDGLYAGSFFPGRVDDGLPGWVYTWFWDPDTNHAALVGHDCLDGGRVIEHKGKVYWLAPGQQSIPVYRILGYDRDRWTRKSRTVTLEKEPSEAEEDGEGLLFEQFDGADVNGSPERTKKGVEPHGLEVEPGTLVRLTGTIEAPLSEAFTFTTGGGRVRLWIDGRQVQFTWNEGYARDLTYDSDPIRLRAGERVPFQLEFYSTQKKPSLQLLWKSFSQDLRPVSNEHLYAADIEIEQEPDARLATNQFAIQTFDDPISTGEFQFDTFAWKQCRCFLRGLGKPGAILGYRNVEFTEDVSSVTMYATSKNNPPPVELRVDAPDGISIGTLDPPESTNGMEKLTAEVDAPSGVHDLYLVHPDDQDRSGAFHPRWFRFE